MYKIPQAEAWHMWDKATVIFDPMIYKIMQYMITKRNVIVEIKRNPTINYGSQLCMRIARVSSDISDHTMALPENILKVLNADFDGETYRGVYGNMCVLLG